MATETQPVNGTTDNEQSAIVQIEAARRHGGIPAHGGIQVYRQITDVTDFVLRIGKLIAESQMFGCKKIEQGQVIALMLLTDQMSVRTFLQTFDLVGDKNNNANLSMLASAMLAEFNNRGGVHQILASSPDVAGIKLSKNGQSFEYMVKWSDLQQEDFVWKDRAKGELRAKYATPFSRSQMLWARCISDAVRKFDPGVNSGTYTPEEAGDFMDIDPAVVSVPATPASETGKRRGRPAKSQETASQSTAAAAEQDAEAKPAAQTPASAPTEKSPASPPAAKSGTSSESSAPAPAAPASTAEQAAASTPAAAASTTSPGPLPSESTLEQIARYRKQLIDAGKLSDAKDCPKWQGILSKLGCPADPNGVLKISLATPQQQEELSSFLSSQIQKLDQQQTRSELSNWANGAVSAGESKAAPGPQL